MKPKIENDNNDIDTKMTRRNKPRLSVRSIKESDNDKPNSEKILNGYCEICHLEYRELQEHLRSDEHQQFIKNESNYLTLDTLIDQTASVDAFLRLNGGTICKDGLRRSLRVGKSPNGKYNGLDDDRPMTRGRSNYHKQFNFSPLSPTGSDSGHHTRSKTNLNSVLDEDNLPLKPKSSIKNRKNSRSSEDDNPTKQQKVDDKIPEHGKSKKCLKTKRISADERLVNDNKTYYKVEVMTTKLRSSGLGNHYDHCTSTKNQSPIPEEPSEILEPSSLVVKFKKIRRSELETLNDEAENFMFPKKEDSSFEEMGTDDGPNTTYTPQKDHTIEIPSSEHEKSCTRNKENHEEFLEKIYIKNIKSLLKDKKSDNEIEETGKRKTRKVIDYHEDNSESDTVMKTRPKKPINYLESKVIIDNNETTDSTNSIIKTRPKKNISYLEESSIDEEIITPKKNNNVIVNNVIEEEPTESITMKLRIPRKKFVIKTYKVKRPLHNKKFKKKTNQITEIPNTRIKIVKKRFKPLTSSSTIKPKALNHKKQKYTKRKPIPNNLLKKSDVVPDSLDETAQDGIEIIESKRYRKRKIIDTPVFDDHDVSKDASRDSISLCDSEGRKRGRRKQSEVFIEENQKYFKFETPVSRLR